MLHRVGFNQFLRQAETKKGPQEIKTPLTSSRGDFTGEIHKFLLAIRKKPEDPITVIPNSAYRFAQKTFSYTYGLSPLLMGPILGPGRGDIF
ncbi:hypothetical protein hamaS1_07010 [Moorella sp. Hama-1]|nr:hypothetical protein hamaS1_07010 [Moorella sp. Hama-1]